MFNSNDLLDRAQLLTHMLLKQSYVAISLKLSLQQFYGRHQKRVDRFLKKQLIFPSLRRFPLPVLIMSKAVGFLEETACLQKP